MRLGPCFDLLNASIPILMHRAAPSTGRGAAIRRLCNSALWQRCTSSIRTARIHRPYRRARGGGPAMGRRLRLDSALRCSDQLVLRVIRTLSRIALQYAVGPRARPAGAGYAAVQRAPLRGTLGKSGGVRLRYYSIREAEHIVIRFALDMPASG